MNSFDYDSFLLLLIRYMDKKISRSEKRYIERTLQESEDARLLMKDVKDTFDWDVSTILPAGTPPPGKKTPAKRARLDFKLVVNGGMMALAIGGLLAFMSLTIWRPHKKWEKDLQFIEEVPESVHGPRISLGTAGEVISDSGYTRIISTPDPGDNKWHNVNVPRGSTLKMKLPDNTTVLLNVDSKLRIPADFCNAKREVYLEGEAYFEVTPDSSNLFVVHTDRGYLASYGKSFHVEAYPDDDQYVVSVLSGRAVVSQKPKSTILVNAGQAASIANNEENFHKASFNEAVISRRLDGRYLFHDKKLRDICRLAERVYNTTILFDREEISQLHLSGALSAKQPVEPFLQMLSEIGNFKFYRDANGNWHLK